MARRKSAAAPVMELKTKHAKFQENGDFEKLRRITEMEKAVVAAELQYESAREWTRNARKHYDECVEKLRMEIRGENNQLPLSLEETGK